MSTALIQPSFAAGEISPQLYARVDLQKFHIGLALLRNCFVDYKGGGSSRPGSKFVGKSKQAYGTPPRLISFQFSQTQTYVLEFGDHYIRFIQNSGYILETGVTISAITKANPGVVTATAHGFSNGDWVRISGVVGMTQVNSKTYIVSNKTTNTFQLTDLWGNLVDTSSFGTYTSGGVAARYYTIVSPYAIADLSLLKFTQSADVMTFTHPSYGVYQLSRLAQTNWSMAALTFGTTQVAPVAVSAVPSATTPTPLANFAYVVTAVNAATGEESVASNIVQCQSVDIAQTAGSIAVTWSAAAGAGSYKVYRAAVGYNTASTPIGALYGYIGTTIGLQLTDNNINPDFSLTPPLHLNPFAPGQIVSGNVTAGGHSYVQATTIATITTATGAGAVLQCVVIGGVLQAIITVDPGHDYQPGDTVAISDSGGGSGATATLTIGALTGIFPGCTAYFQQRQYYANSTNDPDTFWATQPGNYKNMDASNPTKDDDAIVDTIAAQQVNGIQAMVPMPTGLVVLTGLGAWLLTGGSNSTAVTPQNADATAQAYNGCSPNIPPITINYDILYVQEKGSIVRDLQYNFLVNIYTGTDLTVLASHLFTGYTMKEWAWCEEPFKVVWLIRNDGQMLSLTYLKEQDVYAWAHSDTYGLYQSVCSISEPPVNALYYVVQRYLNGQWVYYVERADNRLWNGVEDVWAVDAGLQTTPTLPNATLTVSAATGSVTLTASSAVFSNGMVGNVVRTGGGIITLTGYTSTTVMTGTVVQNITQVLLNNPADEEGALPQNSIPVPQAANNWSIWTPVTSVSGLDHLIGATVSILADGSVQTPRVVDNTGTVTLDDQPVTKVTVGLGFQAQMKSLYLDTGQPTVQGKRKNMPALTIRIYNSRGIKLGRTFDTVIEIKERGNNIFAGTPIPLFTKDERIVLDPLWDVPGQICAQQDYPLPMTILGFIPEVNIGDDNG